MRSPLPRCLCRLFGCLFMCVLGSGFVPARILPEALITWHRCPGSNLALCKHGACSGGGRLVGMCGPWDPFVQSSKALQGEPSLCPTSPESLVLTRPSGDTV